MNDHKPWEFTCKKCSGHGISVFRNWTVLAGPASESWQEWGPLEANHLWRFEFKFHSREYLAGTQIFGFLATEGLGQNGR